MHKARLAPLKSTVSIQKALQGSEAKTRNSLEQQKKVVFP